MNTNDLNTAFDTAEKTPGKMVPVYENVEIDKTQYQRHAACGVELDTRRDDSHPFGVFHVEGTTTKWFTTRESAIEFALTLK